MSTIPSLSSHHQPRYWLLKSEPETFHWNDLVRLQRDCWDGVRNHQAKNCLKEMQVGDLAFFYHSVSEKSIVGVCRIVQAAYPDPTVRDEKNPWVVVDVEPICPMRVPVNLATIKADPTLQTMALLKQSRLSVQPVDEACFWHILALGQTNLPIM